LGAANGEPSGARRVAEKAEVRTLPDYGEVFSLRRVERFFRKFDHLTLVDSSLLLREATRGARDLLGRDIEGYRKACWLWPRLNNLI